MKSKIYHQYPIFPAIGIGDAGIDIFTINPDPTIGNISKVKSIYIDLPEGITLDINLGPDQDH